jgi:hypothetical protein
MRSAAAIGGLGVGRRAAAGHDLGKRDASVDFLPAYEYSSPL